MDTEAEIVDLADTQSLIDIRGGGFDSVLLVGGKPIALNWSDCEGSVAQYMARAGATDYEEKLQSLRRTLDGNLRSDASLQSQIYPFLELFVPGRYRLQYHIACPDCDYIEYNDKWSPQKEYDHFYPYGWVLVFTQPTDALNRERVTKYAQAIQNGHRPIALTGTVEDGWCEFVIDGHHKLQAYRNEQIKPTFISVSRLDAPRLLPDAFAGYIGTEHPMGSHYRKVKSRYDA